MRTVTWPGLVWLLTRTEPFCGLISMDGRSGALPLSAHHQAGVWAIWENSTIQRINAVCYRTEVCRTIAYSAGSDCVTIHYSILEQSTEASTEVQYRTVKLLVTSGHRILSLHIPSEAPSTQNKAKARNKCRIYFRRKTVTDIDIRFSVISFRDVSLFCTVFLFTLMNLLLFTSVWSSSGYLKLVHFLSIYMCLVLFQCCFFNLFYFITVQFSKVWLSSVIRFFYFFYIEWSWSHFTKNGPCMFDFIIKYSFCKCTCHWQKNYIF